MRSLSTTGRAEVDRGTGVPGPTCPRGHVNHTGNRYCCACGVAVAAGAVQFGPRPVVGALLRADGVRVLVLDEVALSSCPPLGSAMVTARIVFLGWDPYALAETPGVRWAGPGATPMPLQPGDSVPLLAGTHLVIGLDAYCYEPLAHTGRDAPRPGTPRKVDAAGAAYPIARCSAPRTTAGRAA